jgi:1-acyl-sn-glycerol-3-phosphate acyltransferase
VNRALLPAVPPRMPRLRPSRFAVLARWLLARSGWRLIGELPDEPKLVVIVAPHSSNWDAVWGILFKIALRLDVHFIGKREAFFWPLGTLLRRLGGIPIDRTAAHDVVGEMSREFARRERFWLAIAPEGTRRRVQKWKSGFWRIARAAGVPILPMYFHYPEKTIGLGPLFHPSTDLTADLTRLQAFYQPWRGKKRGAT